MADFDSFDDLRQSPEDKALAVPLGGFQLPWLPTVAAAERAEAHGHKLGDILDGLQALQSLADAENNADVSVAEMIDGFNDSMSALAKLVWYGFLTFEPDLDLRIVEQHIDQESVQEIPAGAMSAMLLPDADDEEGKA